MTRQAFTVYVDLDPIPGEMHTKESAQAAIGTILGKIFRSYNPEVVIAEEKDDIPEELNDIFAEFMKEVLGGIKGVFANLWKELESEDNDEKLEEDLDKSEPRQKMEAILFSAGMTDMTVGWVFQAMKKYGVKLEGPRKETPEEFNQLRLASLRGYNTLGSLMASAGLDIAKSQSIIYDLRREGFIVVAKEAAVLDFDSKDGDGVHVHLPETYDDETMFKVHNAIVNCGHDFRRAEEIVNSIQNAGILFRERPTDIQWKMPVETGESEDDGTEPEII